MQYKINKDILYVTIFEGSNDDDNLSIDSEAYDIWKELIDEEDLEARKDGEARER